MQIFIDFHQGLRGPYGKGLVGHWTSDHSINPPLIGGSLFALSQSHEECEDCKAREQVYGKQLNDNVQKYLVGDPLWDRVCVKTRSLSWVIYTVIRRRTLQSQHRLGAFFQQRVNKVSLFLFSEIFCCFVAVGVDFVESVEEGPWILCNETAKYTCISKN